MGWLFPSMPRDTGRAPISQHEVVPKLGTTGIPLNIGPAGNVYHANQYIVPRPVAAGGPIPNVSNFGSQAFPPKLWDKNAAFGNPLEVYDKPRS